MLGVYHFNSGGGVLNNIKVVFKEYEPARAYINALGYHLESKNCYKGDRSYLYRHNKRNHFLYLKSEYGFLDDGSMDKGTLWIIQPL